MFLSRGMCSATKWSGCLGWNEQLISNIIYWLNSHFTCRNRNYYSQHFKNINSLYNWFTTRKYVWTFIFYSTLIFQYYRFIILLSGFNYIAEAANLLNTPSLLEMFEVIGKCLQANVPDYYAEAIHCVDYHGLYICRY